MSTTLSCNHCSWQRMKSRYGEDNLRLVDAPWPPACPDGVDVYLSTKFPYRDDAKLYVDEDTDEAYARIAQFCSLPETCSCGD